MDLISEDDGNHRYKMLAVDCNAMSNVVVKGIWTDDDASQKSTWCR